MNASEERQELDNIADTVAQLVLRYRERFKHDPVVCLEYVHGSNATPATTQLQVLGAGKASKSIDMR